MSRQDLQDAGLKVTLPRLKILHLIESATAKHLSAEDIYKSLAEEGSDIALATVYRVLAQFEQAGIVTRHHFEGDHAVYELNQGEHHDHLVCTHCNDVVEFFDPEIERRQEQIAKQSGFVMTDHALNIFGVCKKCQ